MQSPSLTLNQITSRKTPVNIQKMDRLARVLGRNFRGQQVRIGPDQFLYCNGAKTNFRFGGYWIGNLGLGFGFSEKSGQPQVLEFLISGLINRNREAIELSILGGLEEEVLELVVSKKFYDLQPDLLSPIEKTKVALSKGEFGEQFGRLKNRFLGNLRAVVDCQNFLPNLLFDFERGERRPQFLEQFKLLAAGQDLAWEISLTPPETEKYFYPLIEIFRQLSAKESRIISDQGGLSISAGPYSFSAGLSFPKPALDLRISLPSGTMRLLFKEKIGDFIIEGKLKSLKAETENEFPNPPKISLLLAELRQQSLLDRRVATELLKFLSERVEFLFVGQQGQLLGEILEFFSVCCKLKLIQPLEIARIINGSPELRMMLFNISDGPGKDAFVRSLKKLVNEEAGCAEEVLFLKGLHKCYLGQEIDEESYLNLLAYFKVKADRSPQIYEALCDISGAEKDGWHLAQLYYKARDLRGLADTINLLGIEDDKSFELLFQENLPFSIVSSFREKIGINAAKIADLISLFKIGTIPLGLKTAIIGKALNLLWGIKSRKNFQIYSESMKKIRELLPLLEGELKPETREPDLLKLNQLYHNLGAFISESDSFKFWQKITYREILKNRAVLEISDLVVPYILGLIESGVNTDDFLTVFVKYKSQILEELKPFILKKTVEILISIESDNIFLGSQAEINWGQIEAKLAELKDTVRKKLRNPLRDELLRAAKKVVPRSDRIISLGGNLGKFNQEIDGAFNSRWEELFD